MASKLTKKDAIKKSKELWTWLAETGKRKEDWDGWKKYGKMRDNCPLCEYKKQVDDSKVCKSCPYFLKFSYCFLDDSPFDNWREAKTPKIRKKYAKLFLEQLEQL